MQWPQVHSDAAGVLGHASSPQSFLCYLKSLKHVASVESLVSSEPSRDGGLCLLVLLRLNLYGLSSPFTPKTKHSKHQILKRSIHGGEAGEVSIERGTR